MKLGHRRGSMNSKRMGKVRIDPAGIYNFRGYSKPVQLDSALCDVREAYKASGTITIAKDIAVITATSGNVSGITKALKEELSLLGVNLVIWDRHNELGNREIKINIGENNEPTN